MSFNLILVNKGYHYLLLLLVFISVGIVVGGVSDPTANHDPDHCTAIAVGPEASPSGSLTTHTNDCKDCDFRLSLVPRRHYESSSIRTITPSRFAYPRYIGNDRGTTLTLNSTDLSIYPWSSTTHFSVDNTSNHSLLVQPPYTYSYIDGSYGIMNEWGVAMGESTCAARLIARPFYANGSALFDIAELGRIALERSKTAEEAIEIIGELAERYGYYGAEWEGDYAEGESGEALTIVDSTSAWVFHILPDDTGTSAVWVAQRVPNHHVTVVANAFIIREINVTDKVNFKFSSNIYDVAIRNNFWSPKLDVPFDFAAVYGSQIFFEVYCSRRVWRVFTILAPSLKDVLHPNDPLSKFPFSIQPDFPIVPSTLFSLQRDHYEGTLFDLTAGPASGPYGNPNRYDRGEGGGISMGVLMQGTFERPISMFRTAYSFVTESRPITKQLTVEMASRLWFAPASPQSSFYSPLYVHMNHLPPSYTVGHLYEFNDKSTWWSATAIAGWMERMYCYISADVKKKQLSIENHVLESIESMEKSLLSISKSKSDLITTLTEFSSSHAERTRAEYFTFFYYLITRYHDGYRLDDFHAETIDPIALFYPIDWLIDVGFFGSRGQEPDWNKVDWKYTIDPPLIRIAAKKERENKGGNNESETRSITNGPGKHNNQTIQIIKHKSNVNHIHHPKNKKMSHSSNESDSTTDSHITNTDVRYHNHPHQKNDKNDKILSSSGWVSDWIWLFFLISLCLSCFGLGFWFGRWYQQKEIRRDYQPIHQSIEDEQREQRHT